LVAEDLQEHIMLDKHTGLDPPGIKLRAAQGFDATDFFITGYIWCPEFVTPICIVLT
jgi:phospholipid:diacylglycerol acyltransferase